MMELFLGYRKCYLLEEEVTKSFYSFWSSKYNKHGHWLFIAPFWFMSRLESSQINLTGSGLHHE